MKIGVLAWGSLIWDPRSLQTATEFEGCGPLIPLEFSRVSGGKRLTLVIDEANGAPCRTFVAQSACADLARAIANLKEREGMAQVNGVGFVDLATNTDSFRAKERHSAALEAVRSWAAATGHEAVIWTALASNFHEDGKVGKSFTVDAAMEYLNGLDKSDLATALHYIWNAPLEVQTPVRAAVNDRWPQG